MASTDEVVGPLEQADGNDPSIEQEGETLVVTGVPTETEFPTDPTAPITVPTPEGSIQIDPLGTVGGSPPTVANDAAIVTPNTNSNVDTVIRPIYDGFLAFANIRDSAAPETYSWRVIMGKGQSLVQIDEQTAEVIYPADGTSAAMIRAELAHDATGKELPTSVKVEGSDVVTLTVHHKIPNVTYPVVGGPGFEVGYEFVRIYDPPEPGASPSNLESQFYGWDAVSPPEPIDASDGEASASGFKGVKKHFIHVECSHTYGFYAEELSTIDHTIECGNPFQNKPGNQIAFRGAFHGKYFIKEGVKVWHEGGPSDGIGCVAEARPNATNAEPGILWKERKAWVDRCVWWGETKDGGGKSALYGKHITPVARLVGEMRGGCGDNCAGAPNPWEQFDFPPMAFYLWASGHIKFHETDCIDCY